MVVMVTMSVAWAAPLQQQRRRQAVDENGDLAAAAVGAGDGVAAASGSLGEGSSVVSDCSVRSTAQDYFDRPPVHQADVSSVFCPHLHLRLL